MKPKLGLDLNKAASTLRLALDKAGVAESIKAELVFDIDVSGSFEHEHGTTSTLITRLVPYGMVPDPDGQMDVFTFSDGERNAHFVGTVTPDDAEGDITATSSTGCRAGLVVPTATCFTAISSTLAGRRVPRTTGRAGS